MDFKTQIIESFKKVLSGDNQLIQEGTQFLEQNKLTPEFASTLMILIDQQDLQINDRQFAITQLKNLVEQKWKPSKKHATLSEESKTQIKNNIVEAMIRVSDIRKLYKTYEQIIYLIAQSDFPQAWPGVIEQINAKLEQSDDFTLLFGCLSTLRSILKVFEYQLGDEDREPLEKVVEATFPTLLKLASKIWSNYNENTAVLMQVILKIFYLAFNLDIPRYLSDFNRLKDWIDLLSLLYTFQVPEQFSIKPPTEAEVMKLNKVIYWKNKKIVGKILMRFIQKYSSPNLETKNSKGLANFYLENYGTKFIDMFLEMLYKYQTQFISLPTMHYSMRYIQMSLRLKNCVEYLTPKLTELAINICVPILSLSEKDQNLFVSDPIEFMRKEEDFAQTMYNPKNAAMDLIETIAKQNQQKHLIEIMEFFYNSLSSNTIYGQPISIQQKDGIFWAFGELFPDIQKHEQLRQRIELILETFVLPLYESQEPFIRSRVCWLYGVFGCIEFKNVQTVKNVTAMLCQAILDKNLIIKTKAAIALNKFLNQKISKEIIRQEVKNLVGIYLKLMEDVDSEDLVHSLEGIIGNFGNEVKEFSMGLIQSLIEAFYRYVEKESEEEDMYGEGEFAAAGCLNAINKIISSELTPQIYVQLENILIPVMNYTLSEESEYMEEGLDMIAIFIQKTPKISENMYFFFVALNYMIIGIGDDIDLNQLAQLTEEQRKVLEGVREGWGAEFTFKLLPSYKNFIQKDPEFFNQTKDFFGKSFIELMFLTVQEVIKVGETNEDDTDMTNIIDYFLCFIENNLNRNIDQFVQQIINFTLQNLNKYSHYKYFARNCYTVIATCMMYNVNMVIKTLESNGITQKFFEHMFKIIEKNKSSKQNSDLELQKIMMGLSNILTIPQDQIPQSILNIYKGLMNVFVFLTSMILELRECDVSDDEDNGNEDDEDDDDDFFERCEYSDKYDTPLDSVDELIDFEEKFNAIKNKNPDMFNQIITLLDEKQKQTMDKNLQEARKQYGEYLQNQQQAQQ